MTLKNLGNILHVNIAKMKEEEKQKINLASDVSKEPLPPPSEWVNDPILRAALEKYNAAKDRQKDLTESIQPLEPVEKSHEVLPPILTYPPSYVNAKTEFGRDFSKRLWDVAQRRARREAEEALLSQSLPPQEGALTPLVEKKTLVQTVKRIKAIKNLPPIPKACGMAPDVFQKSNLFTQQRSGKTAKNYSPRILKGETLWSTEKYIVKAWGIELDTFDLLAWICLFKEYKKQSGVGIQEIRARDILLEMKKPPNDRNRKLLLNSIMKMRGYTFQVTPKGKSNFQYYGSILNFHDDLCHRGCFSISFNQKIAKLLQAYTLFDINKFIELPRDSARYLYQYLLSTSGGQSSFTFFNLETYRLKTNTLIVDNKILKYRCGQDLKAIQAMGVIKSFKTEGAVFTVYLPDKKNQSIT